MSKAQYDTRSLEDIQNDPSMSLEEKKAAIDGHILNIKTGEHYRNLFPNGKVPDEEIDSLRAQVKSDIAFASAYGEMTGEDFMHLVSGGENSVLAMYHRPASGRSNAELLPKNLQIPGYELKVDYKDRQQDVKRYQLGNGGEATKEQIIKLGFQKDELTTIFGMSPEDIAEILDTDPKQQPENHSLREPDNQGITKSKQQDFEIKY